MDPNLIYTNASDILADALIAFADNSITPPTRQYVQFGQVAADCEELVVEYVGARRLDLETRRNCTPRYDHTFRVWCLRDCEPLIVANNFPTPDSLDDRAHTLLRDAYTLLYNLPAVFKDNDNCDNTTPISLTYYGPSGGIGGSILTLSRTLL